MKNNRSTQRVPSSGGSTGQTGPNYTQDIGIILLNEINIVTGKFENFLDSYEKITERGDRYYKYMRILVS